MSEIEEQAWDVLNKTYEAPLPIVSPNNRATYITVIYIYLFLINTNQNKTIIHIESDN